MENVMKCDRCTKFFNPYKPNKTTKYSNMLVFAENNNGRFTDCKRYQLCEDCMKEACRFMRSKIG